MSEMRFYGVKKGSKKPSIKETVTNPSRPTYAEAQTEFDALEDRKRKLARSAARYVHVAGIQPGDTIPSELSRMRAEMRAIDKRLAKLAESFPRLRP